MPLTLPIQEEDVIAMPAVIFDSTLTLAEIGSILFLAAIIDGQASLNSERFKAAEMRSAMKSLQEKGLLKIKLKGKKIEIKIDLKPALKKEDAES